MSKISLGDRIKVKLGNGKTIRGTVVDITFFEGMKVYDFHADDDTRRYAYPEQIEKLDG